MPLSLALAPPRAAPSFVVAAARTRPAPAAASAWRRSFGSGGRDPSTAPLPPVRLCLVRHGQSTWNRDNRFIGWTDTPLTEAGVLEARVAGQILRRAGLRFDEAHASLLRRSIRTANLVLMELGQEYIPLHKTYHLNERHYGSLVGADKKAATRRHGAEQVHRWRRGFADRPPPMPREHPQHPARDPRYAHMLDRVPDTESLQDTAARSGAYWDAVLAPRLRAGRTLLVVGHENNLRSLLMRLEGLGPEQIVDLSLPRAVPLVYRLDTALQPVAPHADPEARDAATGLLRGEWLGGDRAVREILERDHRNVYDTSVTENLEAPGAAASAAARGGWFDWIERALGRPTPYQAATGVGAAADGVADDDSFRGAAPVRGADLDDFDIGEGEKEQPRAA